jgi:hypothetical protein
MTEPIINIRDLPPMLQEWVDIIGLDATLCLVKRWGGVRVYIPTVRNLDADHWLAQDIGMERAVALANIHQGEYLLIPMATQALNKLKEALIRLDLGNGMSVRDIALKHRVHERRVWRIKASADQQREEQERQQTLF